jgi:hypothetical protein
MLPKPQLTEIMPTSGPCNGGNPVFFVGSNFATDCQIAWDDKPVPTYPLDTSQKVLCYAPECRGKLLVPVYVRNVDKQRSEIMVYTYIKENVTECETISTSQNVPVYDSLQMVEFVDSLNQDNEDVDKWLAEFSGNTYD